MKRRGGFGTGMLERFGHYRVALNQEPQGGLYIHAVSVGEVLIALKFIHAWQRQQESIGGNTTVVLSTTTATGHAIAREQAPKRTRVLYSPLDLPGLPQRCLKRFSPIAIILIEAELWPNMALAAQARGIPHIMINARVSPRSESRYNAILPITRLFFSFLDGVAVQDKEDAQRFAHFGIPSSKIVVTGSIKFDTQEALLPQQREEFTRILTPLAQGRPIILAASTHAGEELPLAEAIYEKNAFPLIIPRHAERRQEIVHELTTAGWTTLLRSQGQNALTLSKEQLSPQAKICYIADTTGELRDWTAHAHVVIIGKSFLAEGGQNPAEAIIANVPVICGHAMENFQALTNMLLHVEGITQGSLASLPDMIARMLTLEGAAQANRAHAALVLHDNATQKTLDFIRSFLDK